MTRKRLLWILLILLLAAQFVPKGKSNPATDPQQDFLADEEIPAEIRDVVQRSCYDCHSNATSWPWYSNVTPIGQWLAHHVEEGRHHLNFSAWSQLSDYRRAKLLDEMEEEVGEGHMPLPSYLWLHREASLDEVERGLLTEWCDTSRSGIEQGLDAPD
jgi:hypothetical protein